MATHRTRVNAVLDNKIVSEDNLLIDIIAYEYAEGKFHHKEQANCQQRCLHHLSNLTSLKYLGNLQWQTYLSRTTNDFPEGNQAIMTCVLYLQERYLAY